MSRLPLATLYLTERCNSRCVSCDYWRAGHVSLSLADVRHLLPSLQRLGTEVVLLSGGEPLLNPEWAAIAALLQDNGLYTWLLTSGLSLAKHAAEATARFAAITVSLDGADRLTYAQIRGLDAFDKVCEGIHAAVARGCAVSIRVTVQRANFAQLRQLVHLAQRLGVRQISFLAVDVANSHAFGRSAAGADLALAAEDLAPFERELTLLEQQHAPQFGSGFIAESPLKMRRLSQYFAALRGLSAFPSVRCNAPEFSAVINARGGVQPCYFIAAPAEAMIDSDDEQALSTVLASETMRALRGAIRSGQRAECNTCVCSLWRDPVKRSGSLRLCA